MATLRFLARTALNDSRRNRGRLILFMSSIVLGIAALVAINSFNYNLERDIDLQAASLLGADLATSGNREAAPAVLQTLDSLPGDMASEMELLSMAYIPTINESQFVRIKAIEGGFPFYGKLKTQPESAAMSFKSGHRALVDEALMVQHGLDIGDSIRLGNAFFEVHGRLQSLFGSNGMSSGFAPTVYIPKASLSSTELVKPGSLINYAYFNKVPPDFDVDQWKDDRRERFRAESMRMETVSDRKENLNEAFEGLNAFLNLVALVALLLGCIGVASSVFIYVKNKIPSIAIFRCLGLKGSQAFTIYFIQIFALGLLGVIVGSILGSVIQIVLPRVLSDLLPLQVTTSLSWRAITEGLVIGSVTTMLFSLVPLLSVRKISPLRTLRTSFDEDLKPRDPLVILVFASIFVSLFLFLWRLTGELDSGLAFAGSLLVSFLVLYGVSKLITWIVRKFFPRKWSFVLRQGISNLYRPNNQTVTLLVSIGLGTAVLTTLFVIQGLLLQNVASMDAGSQPNIILFGIETNQTEELARITKKYDMPVIQQVPIVTMRLEGWQGRSKAEWLADTNRTARGWAIHREARVTYRDTLDPNEKLVKGELSGPLKNPGDSIFISLGERYAEGLDVEIGDELIFNVQGTRMKTYVKSLRELEFSSMNTRFFIVFPTGVLENAPQFHVLVSKSPSTTTTAKYRSEVVRNFPNISVVDLGMILEALGDILRKVSYVIKFMAAFSILTGLIVLISSLLLSKFQRMKESVLLRTIGASRKQILQINATEYLMIGALSASTGIIISLIGSYLLARFQLDLEFSIQWLPIAGVFVIVVLLTALIGLLNSREVVNKPPLEVLRKEVG